MHAIKSPYERCLKFRDPMIKDSSDDRADRKAIEKVSQTSVGLDSLGFVLFWRDATG